MSDLVERLRAVMDYSHTEIRFEAADEIERQYARHAATEKDACKWAQRAEAAEARVKVLENDSSAYKQGYNDGYAFYNRACAMKGACGEVASIEALAQEKDDG